MNSVSARRVRFGLAALLLAMLMVVPAGAQILTAGAMSTAEFLASLSNGEVEEFQTWRNARHAHEQQLDSYWDAVDAKREVRKKKRTPSLPFTENDYVMSLPPDYRGPKLSDALAAKYAKFLGAQKEDSPSQKKSLPVVADYLSAAKRVYDFVPERVSEK